MAKIEYANKEDRHISSQPDRFNWIADNANEVKASVNAIYDMFENVRVPINIVLTKTNFSGRLYQNSLLISLVPQIDFNLISNDGSGTLLSPGDGYDPEEGYTFDAVTGTINTFAGNYLLMINVKLVF